MVEEKGDHIASTTIIPKSKVSKGVDKLESQILTVQSAEAEIKVFG